MIPSQAFGKNNILLWHFDPFEYDRYYEPEIDDTIDCAYWIKKSLDANGYSYDYHYGITLPEEISSYKVIIGTLGFYHC